MRVTFDTNIIISSMLWDNSVANKLLNRFIEKDVKIFTSQEILEEFANVLARDFNYSEDRIKIILQEVLDFSDVVEPFVSVDIVKEDSADNRVLECALESLSDFIITYDNHLLKLGEFRKIKIVRPEEAILII